MTLCFMIKKQYLRKKLGKQQRTGEFIERRTYKPYWRARIGSPLSWSKLRKSSAVFLCGRYAFYADVIDISLDSTLEGLDDVVATLCYNIKCRFSPEELKELETFLAIGQRDDEQ